MAVLQWHILSEVSHGDRVFEMRRDDYQRSTCISAGCVVCDLLLARLSVQCLIPPITWGAKETKKNHLVDTFPFLFSFFLLFILFYFFLLGEKKVDE